MMMIRREEVGAWLAGISPFDLLPEAMMALLVSACELGTSRPGEKLMTSRSERGQGLFVIKEGDVRLFDDEFVMLEVSREPDQYFGAVGLAPEGAPPYVAIAGSVVSWLYLPGPPLPTKAASALSSPPCALPPVASPLEVLCEAVPAFADGIRDKIEPHGNLSEVGGWVGGTAAGPFSCMQHHNAARGWGSVLDVGTGGASLRWLLTQSTSRWAAVTKEQKRVEWLTEVFQEQFRPCDKLLAADWRDPTLLEGEVFDHVIVDYVLGAIERFAPHFQDQFFSRLRPHVGREMYVLGMEPRFEHEDDVAPVQMIHRLHRLRGACMLLVGQQPFREYPSSWVMDSLARSGFEVVGMYTFPFNYGARYVHAILNTSLMHLPNIGAPHLEDALAQSISLFRREALSMPALDWGIRFSSDYLIMARPV